jgi:hypothetical protein
MEDNTQVIFKEQREKESAEIDRFQELIRLRIIQTKEKTSTGIPILL